MDNVVYATLLHCKPRSSSQRISWDQLSVNLRIYFLHILRFRALLVWSASWCCFKLRSHSNIIRGFLGFLAYGTYGLTNYIFFKGYPLSITLLDITWGSLLGGAVSLCGYLIFLRFFYQS